MPIFQLPEEHIFPRVELAEENGLLAVGGDLHPERLLLAYQYGIFPWYSEDSPILWWSPDPRLVLYPEELHISRSMRSVLRKKAFKVTYDTAFADVIAGCRSVPREDQDGTWLNDEMEQAYGELHAAGFAHSVEVWQEEVLVGGLYGIALGTTFFGESMFARASNASKVGFIHLVRGLQALGFAVIDCQVHTTHLESLGAREIPRADFIACMQEGLSQPTLHGSWAEIPELTEIDLFPKTSR